jgi:ribonuclease E
MLELSARGLRDEAVGSRKNPVQIVETALNAVDDNDVAASAETEIVEVVSAAEVVEPEAAAETQPEPAKKPARKPRRGSKAALAAAAAEAEEAFEPAAVAFDVMQPQPAATPDKAEKEAASSPDKPAEKPKRSNRRKPETEAPVTPKLSSVVADASPAADAQPKKGWWQRKSFF